MGQNLTVQEEAEDQDNVCTTENYQVMSEPPAGTNNGPVATQALKADSSENNDKVDSSTRIEQNNVTISSQNTMEISSTSDANGKNLGNEAKKPKPAAKSHFVFTFSRSVPGRTEEQATDSSVGPAKLDVSSEVSEVNKASSEKGESPATAVLQKGSDKNLTQPPSAAELGETELKVSSPPETEDTAPSNAKQVSFFDRLFKLEKGKEKEKNQAQAETQEESQPVEIPDGGITAEEATGLQSTPNNVPEGKDIDDCNQKAVQQGVDPDEAAVKQENSKIFASEDYNNSVMSFFKTLVSPSKSEAKRDSEDKSTKEAQQTTNAKVAEQQPVTSVSVKSEKNAPPSQESPMTKQNVKAPEPAAQQQAAATTEASKDTTKERTTPAPTPLSKLFRKKTSGSTERPVPPTENEPVGQKSKESSKDKTPSAELSKQETKDQQDSREQQTTATDSIQNGGESAKDSPLKRMEKRQSLGGFFKGLGPKRMSDAEVQTDPVSILPAGKSK